MIDQESLTTVSTFKNIYDDFVKNSYLLIYSMVRNKTEALRIMQTVFESIFIVDTYRLLQTLVRSECYKKILKFSRDYVSKHKEEIKVARKQEGKIEFPKELDIFTFNTSIFHNSRTNTIVILRIVYSLEFKDIAKYVNLPCEQVISEYIMVMERIKNSYKEKKKRLNKNEKT